MPIFQNKSLKTYVWLIVITSAVLRLPLLTNSFWLDEAAQALESARPLAQQLNIRDDFQPPLLHLITFAAIRFSTAEWWLRLWGAILPGLVTVLYTYKIGTQIFSKKAGVIAALLLATSSLHIFFSQELRPYSLPTMWAVLSSYALLTWLNEKKQNRTSLIFFALYSIAGLYSSYLYPFLIIGQATWVAITKKDRFLAFLTSLVVTGISFLPWLPKFLEQLSAGTQVRVELPGWEAVVSIPQLKTIPLVIAKFIFGVIPVDFNVPFIAITTVILAAIAYVSLAAFSQQRKGYLIITLWLVVPLTTAWIISFWVPVIQPKRVLFLLPALYLLAGAGITHALKQKQTILRYTGVGLFALLLSLNLSGTLRYYTDPTLQRENWRALHTQILRQYPAGKSVVVFSFPGPFPPWTWYDDGAYPTLSTGKLSVSDVPDLPNLLKTATDKEYILVFDYLRDLTDPKNEIPRALESLGFYERHSIDYPNIGFVRVFTRQATILSTTRL